VTWIKKIGKPLVAIVVLGAIIGFIGHNYVNYVEKQQPKVQISKGNDKTLVFYRDDCSDCQKIFHQVYWQGKLHNNILLINMNNQKNRQYIQKYHLTSVPTFINGNNRYSGTDLKKIRKVVGE